MKNLLSLISMIVIVFSLESRAQITQVHYFGGTGEESHPLAAQSGNFTFITSGTNSNNGTCTCNENTNAAIVLLKLDQNGDTVWVRCYGGDQDEYPYGMVTNDSGGVTIAGYTNTPSLSNGGYDVYVLNINAEGDTIWTRHYGGPGTDIGYSIEKTQDSYLLLTTSGAAGGDVDEFHGGLYDAWVFTINSDGEIIKQDGLNGLNLGGNGQEDFHKAFKVEDGYLLAGTTSSINGDFPQPSFGEYDAVIVKINLDCNDTVWIKKYGGSGQDNFSDLIKRGNAYIAVGTTSSDSINGALSQYHGVTDVVTVTIDSFGNFLGSHCYGGSGQDIGYCVVAIDSIIVIGATTQSNDGDVSGNHGSADTWILKIDPMGMATTKCYGGSDYDDGGNIALIAEGNNLMVASHTTSSDGDVTGLHPSGELWVFNIGDFATNTNPIKLISSMAVYPNPAMEKIHIHLSEPGVHTLLLSDISGKIIKKFTIIGCYGEIERNNVASGMYFLSEVGKPGIAKVLFK